MKTSAVPISRYAALAPHTLLRGCAQACLSVRYAQINCQDCIAACPTGSISIQQEQINIDDNCINCGRCAAACPTGALASLVTDAEIDTAGKSSVRVECSMVPVDITEADTLRVPCVGAISVAQWLRLARLAAHNDVIAIDRGWCETCPAGGTEQSITSHIDEANALIAVTESCLAKPVGVVFSPLPQSLRPSRLPDPSAERKINRRGFLRGLAGNAAQVGTAALQTDATDTADTPNGRLRILPVARLAMVEQLRGLSNNAQSLLPGQLFHRLSVSDACCGHQLCARSCPTTALRAISDDQAVGLGFDPLLCIGCGLCENNCPEHAISLQAVQEAQFQPQSQVLITRTQRECFDCGNLFVANNTLQNQQTCPSCVKSHELGRSLFSDLFRA